MNLFLKKMARENNQSFLKEVGKRRQQISLFEKIIYGMNLFLKKLAREDNQFREDQLFQIKGRAKFIGVCKRTLDTSLKKP